MSKDKEAKMLGNWLQRMEVIDKIKAERRFRIKDYSNLIEIVSFLTKEARAEAIDECIKVIREQGDTSGYGDIHRVKLILDLEALK